LTDTDLDGAYLSHASLSGVTFRRVHLVVGNLAGADLRRADLRGATLSAIITTGPSGMRVSADFRGATYAASTRWPAGFDRRRL
jgi:uncharacterized protein YjbI with pentapeptide repeats